MQNVPYQLPFKALGLNEIGALFPNYQFVELIACGGMGAVYHAIQISLDRHVAIKILPREFSGDEGFRSGFETEAKAMAKLNHPNLISVYDFGEVDGMLFIVMEYVAGTSLYQITLGRIVEQDYAIEMILDICKGLAHAHESGVIHRDIKPSNILLDEKMIPKIGDFGLARPARKGIEEGETIYGTPGYTAPEILRPPYAFDERADVYSVGVMLHEFLTGVTPQEDSRSASQISGCNPRLDVIIRRATYPDPVFRLGSINDLIKELEIISSVPANKRMTASVTNRATPAFRNGAELHSAPYYPPKPMKKRSAGLMILFIMLVLAGLTIYLISSGQF